jgi:hypothetical protein
MECKRIFVMAVAAVTLGQAAATTGSAATLPLIGNQTEVEVTAPLGALGLAGAPAGTASVDVTGANPVFVFPVTGGTLDTVTGEALVEHEGSGVTLSAIAAPEINVTVGNFLIDTAGGAVSGDVFGGPVGLPFFMFGDMTDNGVELLITSVLAGALTDVFGADDLTGAQFGLARPDIAPIPLPAGAWLMLAGAAALGLVGVRRRKAA